LPSSSILKEHIVKKGMLAATLIGTVLAGCSPFAFNSKGYSYKEESLAAAWSEVAAHKYIYDKGEYWESPTEFEARGGGDCEDFAFALVYRLGRHASAVCIRQPDGQFHEIVKYNGRFLEPQRSGMYYDVKSLNIIWVADYDQIMSASTLWGTKSLREKDSCIEAFGG
jgi:hypothetical protein